MNELSDRLRQAVEFVIRNGYASSRANIARRIGILNSTLTMVTNGTRVPTWELLLDFCDAYPIDFKWIRTGEGTMIKENRETVLLKRIAELEAEVERLKE